jgi:DUF1009 family protein
MAATGPQAGPGRNPLAIICGGGTLPFAVADAVGRRGRPVVLFAVRGWADPVRVAAYRHHWITLGRVGAFCRRARAEGCHEVVLIGVVMRPRLLQIGIDFETLRMLPRIFAAFRGGDDHLLTGLAGMFEREGFRLCGAHEVAPEILALPGPLGRFVPSHQDQADISRGLALIAAVGRYDIGQAVVVARNHVLAIEAAEGTDLMLARIAEMRGSQRIGAPVGIGVLVKAPKPEQDRRFDLPTIGPQTIAGVSRAGLAGLAVVAGETLVAEPQAVAHAADRAGVFVVGVGQAGEAGS